MVIIIIIFLQGIGQRPIFRHLLQVSKDKHMFECVTTKFLPSHKVLHGTYISSGSPQIRIVWDGFHFKWCMLYCSRYTAVLPVYTTKGTEDIGMERGM